MLPSRPSEALAPVSTALIVFELVDPNRWRVYYAGVYLYEAHIERLSNHKQMQIHAAVRDARR